MATTQITANPGVPQVEITRDFAAPRALLFRAHTDPGLYAQWLGPRQLTMHIDYFEVRDGGRWRYIHRDPAGHAFGFHGVFHGTPSPDGIVQTFEYEGMPGHVALQTITFEEHDGRTRLRQQMVFQSVAARDSLLQSGLEEGVNVGMERLEELLARLVTVR
jgi:uncharacterized protein YndB with AHSA1/START domain